MTALNIIGDTYHYPNHAWDSPYEAVIGKRKLLRILYYLRTGHRQRRAFIKKFGNSLDKFGIVS